MCWLALDWWKRRQRHPIHMRPPALHYPSINHMQFLLSFKKMNLNAGLLATEFVWDLWLFQPPFTASQKLFTLAQAITISAAVFFCLSLFFHSLPLTVQLPKKETKGKNNTGKCANLCWFNRFPDGRLKIILVTDSRPSLLPWKISLPHGFWLMRMMSLPRKPRHQPLRQSCW